MSLERRVSGYSSVVATKTKFPLILAEAVILDLKSGVYYGLNDVGIQEPKTLNRNSGCHSGGVRG